MFFYKRWLNVTIKLFTTDHLPLFSKEQQPLNLGKETCDDYQTYEVHYQFTNFAIFAAEGPFLCVLLVTVLGYSIKKYTGSVLKKFYNSVTKK